MTLLEMRRKIESLEKRVRELESRPQQIHYHYQGPPTPQFVPNDPHPWWKNPVWCRTSS